MVAPERTGDNEWTTVSRTRRKREPRNFPRPEDAAETRRARTRRSCVPIGVPTEGEWESFHVARRLFGPSGVNLKNITAQYPGVRIHVTGKGSWHMEWRRDGTRQETTGPLIANISSTEAGEHRDAIALLSKLVGGIRTDALEWARARGIDDGDVKSVPV